MEKKERAVHIESTEEIRQYWNDFSEGYSKMMAPNFEGIGMTLFNLVGGRQADVILEVGCGEGTMAVNYTLSKKEGARFVTADIADYMCKFTASRFDRMEALIQQGKIVGLKQAVLQNVDISQVKWDSATGRKWDSLGVELRQADNEDLTQIFPEPNAVDALMASLSLHIVNSPERMLAEAFRVLKPGKSAVFTVWGQRALSHNMTLNERVFEKFGKPSDEPEDRSLFHLNDRNSTIKLVESAGFTDVLAWEEMTAFAGMCSEETGDLMAQRLAQKMKKEGSEATEEEVMAYMRSERTKILKEDKFPIGLSILVLWAKKPL